MIAFNLDLDKKISPSPYSYEIPSSTQKIYFRIVQNNYPIDYDDFRNLSLLLRSSDYANRDSTSNVITIGNEKFVEYLLDGSIMNIGNELYIEPTVTMNNGTFTLDRIRLVMYDTTESSCRHAEWRMFNNLMNNFNFTLGKYYNAIKRDQINQPEGVVELDSDGKVPYRFLPTNISEHPQSIVYETLSKQFIEDGMDIGIHGFKMDEKYRLRYYDVMDETWYVINSIYGGDFGKPNKPSAWDIYGGDFEDIDIIDAGSFTNPSADIIRAGSFSQQFPNIINGNYDKGDIESNNRIKIFGGTW